MDLDSSLWKKKIMIVFLLYTLLITLRIHPNVAARNERSAEWYWDNKPESGSSNDSPKKPQDAIEPRVKFTLEYPHGSKTTNPPSTSPASCTCVPYWLCDEDQVTDGSGIIDIRKGWPCNSVLEVCCKSPKPTPSTSTTSSPPSGSSTAVPGFNPKCGTRNPKGINARILGFQDSEAQFGEYPWMAAILLKRYLGDTWILQFVCGASLVWPSAVITAAHCVKGYDPQHLVIRLGEWDTQSNNEFYSFQDIFGWETIIHPDYYGGALYNDIAIITLEKNAVLAPHIDTICLPSSDTKYYNSSCWATGWGKNAFGKDGSYQKILKEVKLPIISRDQCQAAFRKTDLSSDFELHESVICAGGLKGYDTCFGDGGGPLVCPSQDDPWRYVLVGITSWGVGCGKYGVPGAYVEVAQFREWIDEALSQRIPDYDPSRLDISSSSHKSNQYG